MTTSAHPDLAAVVDLARHAPSVHNTQPWSFSVEGDVLTMRRDDSRRLPVLDPDARQQTISCGAALHLARLGLRLQGFEPVVEATADGDGSLAVRITASPGEPPSPEDVALEHAARSRHTQRGPFDPRPVEPEIVHEMREAAQAEGAWVRFLVSAADQVPLTVLLSHADEAEARDEAYRAELAEWTSRPEDAHDGVPAEAAGPRPGDRASDLRLRDFALSDEAAGASAVASDEPPAAEHPLVAVIGTVGDSPQDWLVAGQALSALLLQATVAGVQASPLGQVLDHPWSRRRLAGELGSVGHPQMVLRLGYAAPGPETPRRPIDDVLS